MMDPPSLQWAKPRVATIALWMVIVTACLLGEANAANGLTEWRAAVIETRRLAENDIPAALRQAQRSQHPGLDLFALPCTKGSDQGVLPPVGISPCGERDGQASLGSAPQSDPFQPQEAAHLERQPAEQAAFLIPPLGGREGQDRDSGALGDAQPAALPAPGPTHSAPPGRES